MTIASNFEATICLKGGISFPARLVNNGSSSCVDSKLQFMLKAIGIKVSHLRTVGQAVIEGRGKLREDEDVLYCDDWEESSNNSSLLAANAWLSICNLSLCKTVTH
jgi:hypothetical protein